MAENRLLGQQILMGKQRTLTETISFPEIDKAYTGSFKFHHPTLIERMNIGVLKAKMLDGLEGRVDVYTDNIAHMTASLEHVLDEAPEWFYEQGLIEYEILEGVFDVYIKWYNSFRERGTKQTNTDDNAESREQV